jgi:DNA-binding HxlR family transcriptional regulator
MTTSIKPIGPCAVTEVLNRIGDRWTMQVVISLRQHPRRFNEIKRHVDGISQQMLTRVLKALERDGLVLREVKATTPPQVTYALSQLGHSLSDTIRKLNEWATVHVENIRENQKRHDDAEASMQKASQAIDKKNG